jgi:hypothetical protein
VGVSQAAQAPVAVTGAHTVAAGANTLTVRCRSHLLGQSYKLDLTGLALVTGRAVARSPLGRLGLETAETSPGLAV